MIQFEKEMMKWHINWTIWWTAVLRSFITIGWEYWIMNLYNLLMYDLWRMKESSRNCYFQNYLVCTNTNGSSVFETLSNLFAEKKNHFTNLIARAADEIPVMVCRYLRLGWKRLKNLTPNVLTIHCIVHHEHFVAKHLKRILYKSMSIFTNVIKK